MPADAAERFATTRVVQSGPVSVAVATLLPDDAGPVVLNAVFERPQRLTEEQWWTTLLMLNVHSLMMTPSAFGLDTLGRTVLVMHLPEDQRSAPMLAAVLKGMVTTCMTLLAEPPPLPPELAKAEGGA